MGDLLRVGEHGRNLVGDFLLCAVLEVATTLQCDALGGLLCCIDGISLTIDGKTAGDTADTVRANADATANNFFITFSSLLNLSDYFSFHI